MPEEPDAQNWRRFTKLRPTKKQLRKRARKLEVATVKHAHTYLIHRWGNVKQARRAVIAWLLLMAVLIGISGVQLSSFQASYSQVAAVEGGTYAEGVQGPLETINPLFAQTSAEVSASKLVFASLLSYDSTNSLRTDVAKGWTVQNDGKRYTVDLKDTIKWHDGKPLTADDVVFTVERIKNPLTRAANERSWAGVTVAKSGPYQVVFDLPAAFAPFPHTFLTFGILPKHLLEKVKPESMREDQFNRNPVGAGPFVFSRLQVIDPSQDRMVVYLEANKHFFRGAPKLERFQLHVYRNHDQISRAFITKEINAATDITARDVNYITKMVTDSRVNNTRLFNGMYAMLNNDSEILKDIKVRQALLKATDRKAVIEAVYGYGVPLEGPLSDDHYESFQSRRQAPFDKAGAQALLEEAGWKLNGNVRMKDGRPLKVTLATPDTGDYPVVIDAIIKQWQSVGVTIEKRLVKPSDVISNVIIPRAYDVLVYELALGIDPDVYPYWHSTQADPRGNNYANYRNGLVDDAVVSGKARSEADLRRTKYEAFFDQWLKDTPAIALYQPTLHYVTVNSAVNIPERQAIADAADRYRSVELWTIDQARLNKTP